ncbi:MAG: protoporphyrinogen oxidase [Intrasporangium sp.]|uniref:protoporphyrinogen oxidase n=1 Tax=Intrasporangium sp. TaxID=1925024 RepID=UPI0026494567|nr:protoporphyrinogen oxidase [Intrasporangium sp.]MDN5794507.1 protoporphyrinogen oxidase [Intrasporangium sp.]
MGVRVAVIGGGISGLAAAWELVRADPGLSVTVLEGSPLLGGRLRLAEVAGAPVDVGAESVLVRRPEATQLADELGLVDRLTHPAAVGASIVSRGARWPMPRGTLMGIPSDPDSVAGLLTSIEVDRLRHEVVSAPIGGDVAIGRLVEDRLGAAVTDKLVEPLLAGIYAGDSRAISAEVAVPSLYAAGRTGASLLEAARDAATQSRPDQGVPGPVFATLVGGLGRLPGLLATALESKGVQIHTRTMVRRMAGRPGQWSLVTGPSTDEVLWRFERVLIATPAAPAARLLGTVAPTSAAALATVQYASMAIVTFAFPGPVGDPFAGSSGFLVPPTEPLTIKASTFSSVKWPWLADAYPDLTFVRASLGRHREEATMQRPDPALAGLALDDLTTVLGPLPAPLDLHVQRWGGGLPQYAVGHRGLVERVRAGLPPTLEAGGAAYDGVGIPACIGSARAAVRRLLTQ